MPDLMRDVDNWAAGLGAASRGDSVWRLSAFRLASYALHLAWVDASTLARARLTEPLAGQLYRAVGSVAANIAEGYSRSSGRDRARLFEYALGSARESVVWYRAAEPSLGRTISESRQDIQQRIVRLLLVAIPHERRRGRIQA
jgi:four helix bundle protein